MIHEQCNAQKLVCVVSCQIRYKCRNINLNAAVEILEAKNYQGRGFAPCSSSDLHGPNANHLRKWTRIKAA
jgi:hypothetical protein